MMAGSGEVAGAGAGSHRGFYLALEGGEGAGKTTVAAALAGRLEAAGHTVVMVREPGGTELGEGIRRLVLDRGDMTPWAEAMLFAAQRAELAARVVAPALQAGSVVISDRSFYSSLAYKGVARGLGLEQVRAVNLAGLGGVVPDLVIVLVVEPAQGVGRQSEPDRIGSEDAGFQREVLEGYRTLASQQPERVLLVDADGEVGEVIDSVWKIVEERVGG